MAAHAEACRALGVLSVPLVVESPGGWSDEAIHTIASTGRLQGRHLGNLPSKHGHRYDTSSAIGHLAMERERHTVDRPPTICPVNVDGLI